MTPEAPAPPMALIDTMLIDDVREEVLRRKAELVVVGRGES
jgi:hypothetical protein